MAERKAVTRQLARSYRAGDRVRKGRILDEIVDLTGRRRSTYSPEGGKPYERRTPESLASCPIPADPALTGWLETLATAEQPAPARPTGQ